METYDVKLTEQEMYLVLVGLSDKAERLDHAPDKAKEYQTLHDRLELIYERRT